MTPTIDLTKLNSLRKRITIETKKGDCKKCLNFGHTVNERGFVELDYPKTCIEGQERETCSLFRQRGNL